MHFAGSDLQVKHLSLPQGVAQGSRLPKAAIRDFPADFTYLNLDLNGAVLSNSVNLFFKIPRGLTLSFSDLFVHVSGPIL